MWWARFVDGLVDVTESVHDLPDLAQISGRGFRLAGESNHGHHTDPVAERDVAGVESVVEHVSRPAGNHVQQSGRSHLEDQ